MTPGRALRKAFRQGGHFGTFRNWIRRMAIAGKNERSPSPMAREALAYSARKRMILALGPEATP